jgi:hypothetical protein
MFAIIYGIPGCLLVFFVTVLVFEFLDESCKLSLDIAAKEVFGQFG